MASISTLAIKQDIKRTIKDKIGFNNLLLFILFMLLVIFSYFNQIIINYLILIWIGSIFAIVSTFIAIRLNQEIKKEVKSGQRLIFKDRWKNLFTSNFYYIIFLFNFLKIEQNRFLIITIVFCILWLITLNFIFKPTIDLKIEGEKLFLNTVNGNKILDFSNPQELELKDGSLFLKHDDQLIAEHVKFEDEEIVQINDFLAMNYGEKQLLKVV